MAIMRNGPQTVDSGGLEFGPFRVGEGKGWFPTQRETGDPLENERGAAPLVGRGCVPAKLNGQKPTDASGGDATQPYRPEDRLRRLPPASGATGGSYEKNRVVI